MDNTLPPAESIHNNNGGVIEQFPTPAEVVKTVERHIREHLALVTLMADVLLPADRPHAPIDVLELLADGADGELYRALSRQVGRLLTIVEHGDELAAAYAEGRQ